MLGQDEVTSEQFTRGVVSLLLHCWLIQHFHLRGVYYSLLCSLPLQRLHAPMGTNAAPVLKSLLTNPTGRGEVGGVLQTPPSPPNARRLGLDCCLPRDESQGLVNSGVFAVLG